MGVEPSALWMRSVSLLGASVVPVHSRAPLCCRGPHQQGGDSSPSGDGRRLWKEAAARVGKLSCQLGRERDSAVGDPDQDGA